MHGLILFLSRKGEHEFADEGGRPVAAAGVQADDAVRTLFFKELHCLPLGDQFLRGGVAVKQRGIQTACFHVVLHLSEQGFVRAVAAHEGDVFFAFRGGEVAVQIALHLIAEAAEVAACAGAERPAGDVGFDQGIVAVAFSAAGIGEMAVADLVPAFLRQRFDGVGVLVGLNVETRRSRKCAFFHHAVDGQHGIEVEGVGVESGQRQSGGAFEIVLPNGVGLVGQAEHQIDNDDGIDFTQFFQIGKGFVAAVFAAEAAADGGVEGLHADGNAVGTRFDAGLGFFYVEMAHTAFDGELAVVGNRQVLVTGADESSEVRGLQRGGRAAAEIDGADFAVALTDFGFRRHFFDDFVGVNAAVTLFPRVAVEAAEHAVVGAEGDVQIGERVGIGGMGELLPPNILPLRTGNRYAAPYRHQRLPFGKGFGRGLARCPNKLLFHS